MGLDTTTFSTVALGWLWLNGEEGGRGEGGCGNEGLEPSSVYHREGFAGTAREDQRGVLTMLNQQSHRVHRAKTAVGGLEEGSEGGVAVTL
uniref:Uncharacterized protein n=1 Tax=Oryza sativa subsp. japonica TaxID=39947 RepID=Q6ERW4_ORYSJ|nr:hypothetical protein [Oryza sativa Japonica Group]BAD28606.1 hypothetical protein [Oryza sativa Japonica Group]